MNVLDASAVLAVVNNEPGASEALGFFDGALISTVNLAEILQKAAQRGIDPEEVSTALREAGLGTVPFDEAMAVSNAALWPLTRHRGLSFGDRACLALAEAVSGIAVTADTAWAGLDLPGITIHVVSR
ncbi:MAG TPA: type II toxin-antitoxin system VapC family toxin [Lacisediminihabitans sp.]|uniref:type II toxin-antitoxin system VapC family toxin n=1 Tax=Lacisediminihabitans sp. TaxID=2787631 RepID=UPI002ED8DBEC